MNYRIFTRPAIANGYFVIVAINGEKVHERYTGGEFITKLYAKWWDRKLRKGWKPLDSKPLYEGNAK
jgi:hypothetical protein